MNKFPDQWDALANIINERNPKKIAINTSEDFGHADGMVFTEYRQCMNKIGPANQKKVVSAEKLAVNWLETRTEREMMIYPQLVQITHDLIREAFSEKVITPGITTTDDVVWWFRKKFIPLGGLRVSALTIRIDILGQADLQDGHVRRLSVIHLADGDRPVIVLLPRKLFS